MLGSPGGSTITNTVLQVLLNVLVYKMDVLQAVASPRFHDQWSPDLLTFEREGFSSDTIEMLQKAGYPVSFRDNMGDCEAIEIDSQSGWRFGRFRSPGGWKGGWILMEYGLSTYLYVNERLSSHILDKISGGGIPKH